MKKSLLFVSLLSFVFLGLGNTLYAQTSEIPCNVGSLSGKDNAIVSSIGISCKCKPTFGELYDPIGNSVSCESCTRKDVCCGVKLNTRIPFIGDCIESSSQASGSIITETTAFPILVSALVKLLISVILIFAFVLIIVAGIMIATGNPKGGREMIVKVAIGLAILGASGVILRLINPNFFG